MNDDDEDSGSWGEVSFAGLVRPVLANIFGRIGKLRFLPKTLAKSADRLSVAIELREHYYSSKEYKHISRIKTVYSIILPAFLRSSLFGTAVFSVYETLNDDYYRELLLTKDCHVGVHSTLVGILSGTAGGLTYIIFDQISRITKLTHLHSPAHAEVKLLKYAGSHGVMFGSYEVIKQALLQSSFHSSLIEMLQYSSELVRRFARYRKRPKAVASEAETEETYDEGLNPIPTEPEEAQYYPLRRQHELIAFATCSAVAGSISGLLYELLWQEMDLHTISELHLHKPSKWTLRRFAGNLKLGMGIALPSSLGFLAYEFGKDAF